MSRSSRGVSQAGFSCSTMEEMVFRGLMKSGKTHSNLNGVFFDFFPFELTAMLHLIKR